MSCVVASNFKWIGIDKTFSVQTVNITLTFNIHHSGETPFEHNDVKSPTSKMGVPFEALLPYGVLMAVRDTSLPLAAAAATPRARKLERGSTSKEQSNNAPSDDKRPKNVHSLTKKKYAFRMNNRYLPSPAQVFPKYDI